MTNDDANSRTEDENELNLDIGVGADGSDKDAALRVRQSIADSAGSDAGGEGPDRTAPNLHFGSAQFEDHLKANSLTQGGSEAAIAESSQDFVAATDNTPEPLIQRTAFNSQRSDPTPETTEPGSLSASSADINPNFSDVSIEVGQPVSQPDAQVAPNAPLFLGDEHKVAQSDETEPLPIEELRLSDTQIDENMEGGIVADLGAMTTEDGRPLTFTVSDPRFEVVAGQLKLKDGQSLDHEGEPEIDLKITASTPDGEIRVQSFTITVGDVNEGPVDLDLSAASVSENEAGAVIGDLSTVDPDAGDSHSYTVSDARFEVADGQLKLRDGVALDHEAGDVTLEITTTDAAGLSRTESFTITVGDVNEGPVDLDLSAASVSENEAGAVIGDLSTVDPDAGDSHSYTVSDARFEVADGQLKLRDGVALDHEAESEISIDVTTTDSGGLSHTETFNIDVRDVNEAPTDIVSKSGFSAKYFDVDTSLRSVSDIDWNGNATATENISEIDYENGSSSFWEDGSRDTFGVQVVGDINVKTGGSYTFDLSADDGAVLFIDGQEVVNNDGLHAYNTRSTTVDLDPGEHSIEVRYFENYGHAGLKLEWEGPDTDGKELVTSSSELVVDENSAGSHIANLTVTDPDENDTFTLTVSDERFEVVDGQLKLKDGVSLDHEAGQSVSVDVMATDAAGATYTETFEISVTDINEGPTDIDLSNFEVSEEEAGAVIGKLSTTDQDVADTHSYTVSDARFEVVDGQLKLRDDQSLDFAVEPEISLKVTTTDKAGQSYTETFDIDVTDKNEAPTLDLNVVALDAPGTNGLAEMSFSGVSVSNTGQTEAIHGEGQGEAALWANVGTFQGQDFDIKATVVDSNTSGYRGSFFSVSGDNASFWTNAGETTVKYEFFVSGTDEEMIINGSFLVDDLDGGRANEHFSIDMSQVDAYGVERGGDIEATDPETGVRDFAGVGYTSSGDSEHAVAFNMAGSDGFTLTYGASSNGRAFYLDGDWTDGYFDNVVVTDTNFNHADVFTEGSAGTQVVSNQVAIDDTDGKELFSAELVLTNAQLDDELVVGTLPKGITARVDTSVEGQVTVTLEGAADHETYETALKSITFKNDSETLSSVERTIQITVNDGIDDSAPAEMTVYVNNMGNDGLFQDTGSADLNDILTGNADNNELRGLGGDDSLEGGGGDDLIKGGDGSDTALYSGSRSDYKVEVDGNGDLVVTDLMGDDGMDTLVGVETLQFADGDFAVTLSPKTGTMQMSGSKGTEDLLAFEDPDMPATKWADRTDNDQSVAVKEDETAEISYAHDGGPEAVVSLSGLPSGTMIFDGENAVMTDGSDVDLSGWDLTALDVSPPYGFTGTIDAEISVSVENSRGTTSVQTDQIEIEVGDPTMTLSQSSIPVNHAQSESGGWVEASEMPSGAEGAAEQNQNEENVMNEEIVVPPGSANEAEQFETYERSDW